MGTAPFLHEYIQDLPILIHSPPQVVALASDADEQLVQMPGVAWPTPAVAELPGECLPELETPETDRFVADGDTPLSQ